MGTSNHHTVTTHREFIFILGDTVEALLHRSVGRVNTYELLYEPKLGMTGPGTWEMKAEETAKHRDTDWDSLRKKSCCPLHIPEAF